MNKNLKIVLISIFVIAFLLFLAYIILKNTFGINKTGSGSISTVPLNPDGTSAISGLKINSPEDLALRTYRAATGQNSI